MPSKEDKAKYDMEYAKKNLKRIPLDVHKEKYEEIKTSAETTGEKVNSYIKAAIDEKMSQISIPLKESINTNNNLQEKLECLLLANSDSLTGYSREYSSDGSAQLILKFKSKAHITEQVIDAFKKILREFNAL